MLQSTSKARIVPLVSVVCEVDTENVGTLYPLLGRNTKLLRVSVTTDHTIAGAGRGSSGGRSAEPSGLGFSGASHRKSAR